MAEQPITLIKGQKVDANTDYRDNLPINVSGVLNPVLGAQGYMLQQPGLTEYGNPVALADHEIYYPDAGTASYRLNTNGQTQYDIGAGFVQFIGEWLLDGAAASYECRMTAVTGSFTSGTVGSWLALSSTRTWTKGSNGAVEGLIEIRAVGTEDILASASITLLAPVNLSNHSLATDNEYPDVATALFRLTADGAAEYSTDAGDTWTPYAGEWKLGGDASEFQAMMTEDSGTFSSGTVDEWVDLDETRTWSRTVGAGDGTETVSGTLAIRQADGEVQMASCTIGLTAESEAPPPPGSESYEFFDSSTYLSRDSDLSGNANGKRGTFAAKVRFKGETAWLLATNDPVNDYGVIISLQGSESGCQLSLELYSAGGSLLVSATQVEELPEEEWLSILLSWDTENTDDYTFYVNDVAQTFTVNNWADGAIGYSRPDWRINYIIADDAGPVPLDLSIIWLDVTQQIDFSVEDNRRDFFDADGCTADELPSAILSLAAPDLESNLGTGGDFTQNGSPDEGSFPCP